VSLAVFPIVFVETASKVPPIKPPITGIGIALLLDLYHYYAWVLFQYILAIIRYAHARLVLPIFIENFAVSIKEAQNCDLSRSFSALLEFMLVNIDFSKLATSFQKFILLDSVICIFY
jgi:hypothetical protein